MEDQQLSAYALQNLISQMEFKITYTSKMYICKIALRIEFIFMTVLGSFVQSISVKLLNDMMS